MLVGLSIANLRSAPHTRRALRLYGQRARTKHGTISGLGRYRLIFTAIRRFGRFRRITTLIL